VVGAPSAADLAAAGDLGSTVCAAALP